MNHRHHSFVTYTSALLISAGMSLGMGIAPSKAQTAQPIYINVPPPETGYPVNPPSQELSIPTPPSNRICPAGLGGVINGIINRPTFASARWGVLVESLGSQGVLFSHNPEQFLIPASNVKLLTTAAALQTLNSRNATLLASRIGEVNTYSDNDYADAMLRQIGGSRAAQNLLSSLGIDANGYRQVDGSGLSRSNLAKPSTLVALLRAMYYSSSRDLFFNSLPIAGASGTLRNRFRGTPAAGIVHAKTGTLTGVRALSGKIDHPEYGPLLFSIVVNQPGQSGEVLVRAIDNIVVQLTRLTPC